MTKLTREQIQQAMLKDNVKRNAGYHTDLPAEFNVSLEDIEAFGNKDSLREMLVDIGKYNRMLEQRITLINDSMTAAIPFTRENLYLFCAFTGFGKSTVAANISHPLWKQGKKILVISNEESQQDILFRIACLETGQSFNAYKKGEMSVEEQKKAIMLFPEISKHVKVIDVNYNNGLTTKVEGVMTILEAVKKEDNYSCVMIDYYQLIKFSHRDPSKSTYDNLNNLRVWLGQFIKSSSMPIVLFAQLYSISKRGGAKDIDARLKECSSIVEPATVIIEIIPNFENRTTDFIVVKDRFGRTGRKVVCGFENGRYTKLSPNDVVDRIKKGQIQTQHDELDKFNALATTGEKK